MKKGVTMKKVYGITLSLTLGLTVGSAMAAKQDYLMPQDVPAPKGNETTTERVELGKSLFFDPRLSGSNWISCGTCHNPSLGWSDGLPKAIGHGMNELGRATPTVLNTAFNRFQFWDGRARSLEEQAVGPIQAAGEMNQNMEELVKELNEIDGYKVMFEEAYPGEGISETTIGKAIAAFERTVVTTETPFDQWVKGDASAIDESAKRGFEVFEGKGRCNVCHSGFNFTDNGFHNLGLAGDDDPGRFALRKVKVLKGAFKTPTLRDVTRTAPYMHNGSYATLEEVIDHYDRGGDVKEDLSPNMKPLNLSKQEKVDLVAFLESLTSITPMDFTYPHLPQK